MCVVPYHRMQWPEAKLTDEALIMERDDVQKLIKGRVKVRAAPRARALSLVVPFVCPSIRSPHSEISD